MNAKKKLTSKVPYSDVVSIRAYGKTGQYSYSSLGKKYNVSPVSVKNIVEKKSYQIIPDNVQLLSHYELTPDGRVWSNASNMFLKTNRNGRVTLHDDGNHYDYRVHNLMREYFNV